MKAGAPTPRADIDWNGSKFLQDIQCNNVCNIFLISIQPDNDFSPLVQPKTSCVDILEIGPGLFAKVAGAAVLTTNCCGVKQLLAAAESTDELF